MSNSDLLADQIIALEANLRSGVCAKITTGAMGRPEGVGRESRDSGKCQGWRSRVLEGVRDSRKLSDCGASGL